MEKRFNHFSMLRFAKLGEVFGETSLEFRNKELYSIICATECEFAVISSSNYYLLLSHKFFLTYLEQDKMLKKTQLLRNWPNYAIYEISKMCKRRVLSHSQVLFNIGDKIDQLYFFSSGALHKFIPLST